MTSIILTNAVLGAAALTVILSLVAWAIKTQQRDAAAVGVAAGTRRQAPAPRRSTARRRLAQPVA